MAKRLKDYFPMLPSREEVLKEINTQKELKETFESWREEEKEAFLDICTGVRGVKVLYDAFFKEIMNPEYTPQRLNAFLSLVLKEPVRVMNVLPNESTRITDESSLLIMDIVVEFESGGIANVEVQKVGYLFPGQRSACYSADLLLRQYKRLRDEKKKRFSYRDIQTVYTIVLFEQSPKEFQAYPGVYRHCFEQKSDTGIELKMLQKFIYISLDIFRKKQQNEVEKIHNKLEAWLTFLCRDEPEMILELVGKYPEFKALYEDVYQLCRNVEGVMEIFSKELLEMDRNTVKLMVDLMQDEIEKQERILEEQGQRIEEQDQRIEEQGQTIENQAQAIVERNQAIQAQARLLREKDASLDRKDEELECMKKKNEAFEQRIAELEKKLAKR